VSHCPHCWGFAQNLVNYIPLLPFNCLNTNVGAACYNYTRTNSSDDYSINDFCYCFYFHPTFDYVFYYCRLWTLANSYFSVLDFIGNCFGAGVTTNGRDMEAVVANRGRLTDEAGSNSTAAGNKCLLRDGLGPDGGFLLACARSTDCITNSTAHGSSFKGFN
jgi:hypothetical protein